jgi:hypothetical protein
VATTRARPHGVEGNLQLAVVEGPVEGDHDHVHAVGSVQHLVTTRPQQADQWFLADDEEPGFWRVFSQIEQEGVRGGDHFLGGGLHPESGELGRVVRGHLEWLVRQVDDPGVAFELVERLLRPWQ